MGAPLNVVGLRAVTSTDGMTADFYPFDMKFLGADHQRGQGRQPRGVWMIGDTLSVRSLDLIIDWLPE